MGRPAIAESRIVEYDGVNVTFKYTMYEDNEEVIETIQTYEVIKDLIINIQEKSFKIIRYFGIYSRRSKEKNNFIKVIDEKNIKLVKSEEE